MGKDELIEEKNILLHKRINILDSWFYNWRPKKKKELMEIDRRIDDIEEELYKMTEKKKRY